MEFGFVIDGDYAFFNVVFGGSLLDFPFFKLVAHVGFHFYYFGNEGVYLFVDVREVMIIIDANYDRTFQFAIGYFGKMPQYFFYALAICFFVVQVLIFVDFYDQFKLREI